jgi:hypothetical protein
MDIIKVEPDSDVESEELSSQLARELAESDDKQGAMSFIFVPVQPEIKVGYFPRVLSVSKWNSVGKDI